MLTSFFKRSLWLAALLPLLLLTGCEWEPVDPSPPPPPQRECEQMNTATLNLRNRSIRTTYTIVLDGATIGSVQPGSSLTQTVSAGQHQLVFRFANQSANACYPANPQLVACRSYTYSCSRDL